LKTQKIAHNALAAAHRPGEKGEKNKTKTSAVFSQKKMFSEEVLCF
jgi:hypothetical protein